MIEALRELGRSALRDGLTPSLRAKAWGSPEMAEAVNLYLMELCRNTGLAILVRLSPWVDMGLDVVDGTTAAAQLAAVQSLSADEFGEIVRDAWTAANDKKPPAGAGYQHFRGEVTLETLRRLKRKTV